MIIKQSRTIDRTHLSSGLSAALSVCFKAIQTAGKVDLELSENSFVSPSFVIPLLVFSSRTKNIGISTTNSYHKKIYLPEGGIDSENYRKSEMEALFSSYSDKTYIPIVKFPTSKGKIDKKDSVIYAVCSLIDKQAKIPRNIRAAIDYILGETADNMSEHSRSEYGYIFAQAYPGMKYIDICLADTGITLWGSYKESGIDVGSDVEAVNLAVKGLSTKNLPEAENRGFGITTSRETLVKGLNGQYLLASGSACFIHTPEGSACIELPLGIRFEGTIVAIRVPYAENLDFRLVKYLERRSS